MSQSGLLFWRSKVRPLWGRLPSWLRKGALTVLFGAIRVRFLPPLPHGRVLPPGPCVVIGFFSTFSGLGEAARQLVRVMRDAGIDVHTSNISDFAIADMAVGPIWPNGLGTGGAAIAVFKPDIAYPVLNALRPYGLMQRRLIAYWHWELAVLPSSWVKALRHFDEIWVPSRFMADAVRRADPAKTVHVVPDCLDVAAMPIVPRHDPWPALAGRPLVFFSYDVRSSQARKNPEAVIAAFCQAVDGMCIVSEAKRPVLVIKMHGEAAWPPGIAALRALIGLREDIMLISGTFPRATIEDMIARADVVMSLHRSEGFGYLMAEAMAAGCAVIATNWSGNIDFMSADSVVLVPYQLVPVDDPQRIYTLHGAQWAEPNVDFAAAALRRLLENADERAALGVAARACVARYFSVGNWQSHLPTNFRAAIAPAWPQGEVAPETRTGS